jgi:hypothetical protein
MPLADIQLLFETLVQRTRDVCKCEMRDIGSKECNAEVRFFREPTDFADGILCCGAKYPASRAPVLDRRERAS